jgi:hypothetical protein
MGHDGVGKGEIALVATCEPKGSSWSERPEADRNDAAMSPQLLEADGVLDTFANGLGGTKNGGALFVAGTAQAPEELPTAN